jgi:5-methylcytosine-specific restriction enzyme subunit McrC
MAYARLYRCRDVMLLYPHHNGLSASALDAAYRMTVGDEPSVDLSLKEAEIFRRLATLTLSAELQSVAPA